MVLPVAGELPKLSEGDLPMDILHNLSFKHGILIGIAAIIVFILLCQYLLWYVALALLIMWLPWCIRYTVDLFEKDCTLALYFMFIALQTIHMGEHVAQMVQIHILGRMFSMSHGIFGAALDVEMLHFAFDSLWIPFWTIYLIYKRRDIWMIVMLPLVLLHCCEHIVIMDFYLRTGITGSPGIMAMGGLIGSPLSRPDLHFLYNLAEESFMVWGFKKAVEA
jgi:hypothetical protein